MDISDGYVVPIAFHEVGESGTDEVALQNGKNYAKGNVGNVDEENVQENTPDFQR